MKRIEWAQSIPFFLVHLVALVGPFLVPFSWTWVVIGVALYFVRMFGITAGYHRYFSHRAYKTSRWFQAVLAFIGTTSAQKGVLWWAANHRHHHLESDQPSDIHSPVQDGFWWSHVGWIMSGNFDRTQHERIKDFASYPELHWLNRHHLVPPLLLALLCLALGGTTGLIWGFFVSTVLCWHGTFTINSLSHVFGSRRYATKDDSRNNFVLALITMGEGWHNNHHHYQSTAHQGFYWWEVDMSYYLLRGLERVGLVWDLRKVPKKVRDSHTAKQPSSAAASVAASVVARVTDPSLAKPIA